MDQLNALLALVAGITSPPGDARAQALALQMRDTLGPEVDLRALEAAAVAQFETTYAGGQYPPAEAATLLALDDVTAAVRLLAGERDQAQQQMDAAAARMQPAPAAAAPVAPAAPAAAVAPAAGVPAAAPPAAPAGVPAAAPQTTTTPAGAPEAGPGPGDDTAGGSGDGGQAPPSADPDNRPVGGPPVVPAVPAAAAAAPVRRPSTVALLTGGATAGPPAPALVAPLRTFSITASAEVPEFPFGMQLTPAQLGDAAVARFSSLPVGQPATGPIKANVARVHRLVDASITLTGDQGDTAILDRVADERRLPGGSLLAAQQLVLTAAAQAPSTYNDVWCTPSETDYTLCPSLATTDGIVDLPSAGMPTRGGLRYPKWTQYPEQAADAARNGWHGTAITYPEPPANPGTGLDNPVYFHRGPADVPPGTGLGNTKKCISGPCVEWAEVRASLAYLCVESDILRDRTFPEGIARFSDDVLIHHQHYLNELFLTYIQAHSDPIPDFSVRAEGQIGSVSLTAVDRLALLITWFRNRYKMARGATLEVIAPEWFREYLKRDIEKKQNRPYGAVTDAEIATLFAQYTSRVQWVRDWQEMGDGAPVGPPGATRIMPPAAWPASVKLMAYPAGSWVKSLNNILNLGVQYDYTLLKENRYSAMFTEDQWMLLNRCNRTFVITLTELCANGAVGPQRDSCPPPPPPALLSGPEPTEPTEPVGPTGVTTVELQRRQVPPLQTEPVGTPALTPADSGPPTPAPTDPTPTPASGADAPAGSTAGTAPVDADGGGGEDPAATTKPRRRP